MDAEAKFRPLNVKRMIAGGRSRLSAYQVRGWTHGVLVHAADVAIRDDKGQQIGSKVIEVKKPTYLPMGRVELIKAVSGYEAAKQYARSHGLVPDAWQVKDKTIDKYAFVIRVSNIGEKAP